MAGTGHPTAAPVGSPRNASGRALSKDRLAPTASVSGRCRGIVDAISLFTRPADAARLTAAPRPDIIRRGRLYAKTACKAARKDDALHRVERGDVGPPVGGDCEAWSRQCPDCRQATADE